MRKADRSSDDGEGGAGDPEVIHPRRRGLTRRIIVHTFASLSFAAREHPGMVQKILGHSSIVQTMDTYSHLVPGMADDAAERFGGYLFGGE
jgi:integrase